MPMKTILQDTHPLDAAGVDNISEQIADVLADYPYITKRDILRLRLSAEEILLHWRQEAGALRVQLSIEEKGRWLRWRIWASTGSTSLTTGRTAPISR